MARRLFSALAVLIFVLNIFPAMCVFAQGADTAARLQGGICVYKAGSDIQGWIDGELTKKAGLTSEWYIMTLAQSGEGYDFSSYEKALLEYLKENKVASATSREKYALALISIGSSDGYILRSLSDSVGQQGLMSLIFGLHIVNNGYTADGVNAGELIGDILALQLSDGGFAIIGSNGDPDCTAMTVTALAPYYGQNADVKAACDKALGFLSGVQQASGAYRSFGKENCESTAQVLLALCSLGIDPQTDSRFIKGGNDLLEGLAQFAKPDGSFEHAKGEGTNDSATVQAFYSLKSYERMGKGKSAFFIFDNRSPQKAERPVSETPKVTTSVTARTSVKKTSASSTDVSTKADTASRTLQSTKASSDERRATEKSTQKPEAQTGSTAKKTTTKRTLSDTRDEQGKSVTEESLEQSEPAQTTASSELQGETSGGSISVTSHSEGQKLSSEASSVSTDTEPNKAGKKGSIKLYIYIAIGSAALIGCIVLLIRGKRNIKSFVFIIAIGGVLCAVTAALDIETREEHFAPPSSVLESESAGSAAVSIDCLTIAGEGENVPESGYILEESSFEIKEGETAFELLERVSREQGILLDIKGSDDMIYVSGIAGIYEFDYGELSGWMYYVNGKAPSVNSSQYVLKDGDRVEWRYTREIGHDLDGEDEYYEND